MTLIRLLTMLLGLGGPEPLPCPPIITPPGYECVCTGNGSWVCHKDNTPPPGE